MASAKHMTRPMKVRNLRSTALQGRSKSFHSNQLLARSVLKSLSGKVFCSMCRARAPAHSRNA
ncbi:hypothetical protein FPL06_14525 [Xanthomonas citri pv. glycines]|nr:hypothetical protein FPK90_10695 [Xanthomonas citri pv. glycines]QDS07227.1 hypothetical protein FPL00_10390 [Xanthomonas citri pv. glycines]QDS11566.1 hypothetical protein FPL03_10660 [Xanthomonas citri pv. glycines]QDS20170.1 hypothetical protein FPL05_10760 [Xanthomonas citri pv. glycines]TSJ95583.1 hypothetical protein FPK99_14770 [Xanthomonas citri pv. glycines]